MVEGTVRSILVASLQLNDYILSLLLYCVTMICFFFSGTRSSGLDNEPDFANQTCDKHMPECDAVTPLQADTSASKLRHYPNQILLMMI